MNLAAEDGELFLGDADQDGACGDAVAGLRHEAAEARGATDEEANAAAESRRRRVSQNRPNLFSPRRAQQVEVPAPAPPVAAPAVAGVQAYYSVPIFWGFFSATAPSASSPQGPPSQD